LAWKETETAGILILDVQLAVLYCLFCSTSEMLTISSSNYVSSSHRVCFYHLMLCGVRYHNSVQSE